MKTASLFMVVGVLAACSSAPAPPAKPPPKGCPAPETKLSLTATKRVNPSAEGEGRPIQVRVYQLVSDTKLRNATFEEIWQKDREVLKADLKTVAEQTVFPGETKKMSLKRSPDAHYVTVVALFREPQGKDWYVSYELAEPPAAPPCASPAAIPVFLDRMQIQDGEGRTDEAAPAPAAGDAAPAERGK
jgi:type VI secretion system protein VasD